MIAFVKSLFLPTACVLCYWGRMLFMLWVGMWIGHKVPGAVLWFLGAVLLIEILILLLKLLLRYAEED